MTNPRVRKMRRAGSAALLLVVLSFSVAACGGDTGNEEKKSPSAASSAATTGSGEDEGKNLPDTSQVLVTVHGDSGIDMIIHSAKRDTGGFLTVSGQFKNTGSDLFTTPIQWGGAEEAVAATGRSLAGMTLVDSKEKKRFYVLRDTDNRPLTTSGYEPSIAAGKSLAFFAQFPAPAQSTTQVDLQFPGFTNATIEIS
ncbi:hypothetical protein [Streptomyces sp. bgisy091]|uniref:hypothetical protein n=1 Tax=Streptomyces sp. bgisy091 TaxID=3413778 RepID=UPI003D71BAF8